MLSLSGRAVWSRQKDGHWEIGIHLGLAEGKKLLKAALPKALLKIEAVPSLQARSLRIMGRVLACTLSLISAELVTGFFLKEGILPPFSAPSLDTTFRFFWLSVFLILSDGLKVYFEITGRSTLRQYSSDMAQVTAVIACHNTGKPITHTIEAATSMLSNDRVIVVDDASTDDTAAIAMSTDARVVPLKKNVGKSGALTIGLQHVKTKYALILDDDTRLKNIFLPTSLLDEGFSGIAFNVLPCRRTRESTDGKNLITCIQRYEYAKSMEIGRRFLDKTGSVSCISGAIGLFRTDLLREVQAIHSDVFPGEDLERTLILLLKYKGRIVFVNEIVWTVVPDSLKSLTWQRLMRWYPGYYRLMGVFFKIMINRTLPGRLRFEMFYNIYVVLSDPLKMSSFLVLLVNGYWSGIIFLYLFYLALEIYPFLTIDKKLPVLKYYIPTFLIYPVYGTYNAFLRTASFFVWVWHRYATKQWKPKTVSAQS